ncbi:MAG: ribosome maturation factor RimM [Bacteroidota bacterium]
MAEQFISVGKLGKPHGISGAFRFLLHRELKSKKKFPSHFMIQQKGSFLPWFIIAVEWLGFSEGFILFEEISTPEKAKLYSTSELFLSEKSVESFFKKHVSGINYLVGYKAMEEKEGEIGIIEEVIENPGQILCLVKRGFDEIMIPLVDEFVSKIDKRKREITFKLPEGLLEL